MTLRVSHWIEDSNQGPGTWPAHIPSMLEALAECGVKVDLAGPGVDSVASRLNDSDLVHVHDATGRLARELIPALVKKQVPHLVSTYGGWTVANHRRSSPWRSMASRLKRPLLPADTWVHAVSEQEAQHLRARGIRGRIEIVPLGVNAKSLHHDGTEGSSVPDWPVPRDARVIAYVGPLDDEPGLAPFLKACSDLEPDLDGWHIVLAGQADEHWQDLFAAAVRRHGGEGLVSLLPSPSSEVQAAILRRADLFVSPNTLDRPPAGALQAMACGVPVLTTPASGLSELAKNAAVQICQPDRAAFGEALEALIGSSPQARRQMGAAARDLVSTRYAWSAVAPRHLALYHSIISQKGAPAR